MPGERAAAVEALHAAVDRAIAYAKATGQPTPKDVIDHLKVKAEALDDGRLDLLKAKLAELKPPKEEKSEAKKAK